MLSGTCRMYITGQRKEAKKFLLADCQEVGVA